MRDPHTNSESTVTQMQSDKDDSYENNKEKLGHFKEKYLNMSELINDLF